MEFVTKGVLIEKIKKEYSFNGREGTSRKARFLVGTNIFSVSFGQDDVDLFESLPEKGSMDLVFVLDSIKEEIKLKLKSFKADK